ncbi:hypothetical protein GCM10027343_30190 [Noviherbaspirillum agri]
MKIGRTRRFPGGAVALAALLPVLFATDARAIRIAGMESMKGLTPLTPVVAVGTPTVRTNTSGAGALELRLAEHGTLSLTPWPTYLPQHFAPQRISVSRELQPAGPVDRIALIRGTESEPWMQIVRGARSASHVVGGWQLQRSSNGWSLVREKTEHWLGSGAHAGTPASLPAGDARWCVYLLESRVPQRHPNAAHVAIEEEPQADWAAIRLESGHKRCPPR